MVSEIQILSTKYADSNNSKIKHKIPFNSPLIRFKSKSKMKKNPSAEIFVCYTLTFCVIEQKSTSNFRSLLQY